MRSAPILKVRQFISSGTLGILMSSTDEHVEAVSYHTKFLLLYFKFRVAIAKHNFSSIKEIKMFV